MIVRVNNFVLFRDMDAKNLKKNAMVKKTSKSNTIVQKKIQWKETNSKPIGNVESWKRIQVWSPSAPANSGIDHNVYEFSDLDRARTRIPKFRSEERRVGKECRL